MADRTIPRRRKAQVVPLLNSAEGATMTPPLAPRRVLEIVCPQRSESVVELLEELLRRAEAGEIAGLVAIPLFTSSRGPKKYGMSLGGSERENPQLAVGAVDVCHMLLRELALKDAGIG